MGHSTMSLMPPLEQPVGRTVFIQPGLWYLLWWNCVWLPTVRILGHLQELLHGCSLDQREPTGCISITKSWQLAVAPWSTLVRSILWPHLLLEGKGALLFTVSTTGARSEGRTTLFWICHPRMQSFPIMSSAETLITANSLLDYPFGKGQIFRSLSFPWLPWVSHGPFPLLSIVIACSLRNKWRSSISHFPCPFSWCQIHYLRGRIIP